MPEPTLRNGAVLRGSAARHLTADNRDNRGRKLRLYTSNERGDGGILNISTA